MSECCRLGAQIDNRDEILFRTNNFTVTPALGQIGIEGYCLICSNEHFIGMGDMPASLDSELEAILSKTLDVISNHYSPRVVVFEHGPRLRCNTGGSCLEHAHFHIVPTGVDILGFLSKHFKPESIKGLERLREIYRFVRNSYLFLETQERKRFVFEVQQVPSQYIRQIIAVGEGKNEWDWRKYPDYETFKKTLEKLRGKF